MILCDSNNGIETFKYIRYFYILRETETLYTNKMTTQTTKIQTAKLIPCWNCGELSAQFKRWYHGDQDDLVCLECAKKLTHNDTAYAGQSVDEMDVEVASYFGYNPADVFNVQASEEDN